MITIKKEHNLKDKRLIKLIKKFNNVIRYSYNRKIKDGITKLSDLEKLVKSNMLNIDCLDSSWIKCAVKKSTELQTDNKLYFGGKSNFFKRKFKKIEKLNKDFPLEMRGSKNDNGNRKSVLNGNKFIFKPSKGIKFEILLDLSRNEKRMLGIIEQGSKNKINYFNFKISEKYIWISFEEPKMQNHEFKPNRYLGIDLNPNWIAISIMDRGSKEIYKQIIDLRILNECSTNKKNYEISMINKYIINLCKNYKVEYVCLEDLNIRSSDKKKGKNYNRLINNKWNRNYLINNLVKWLNINDIKYLMVNPFYTSYIGQLKNIKDYDSVAASKEMAFRGYLMINGFRVQDYVNQFLSGLVTTHWKEMLPNVSTYKDLYDHFKIQKKSKNSYRFLFSDFEKSRWSCLRLNSHQSKIDLVRV